MCCILNQFKLHGEIVTSSNLWWRLSVAVDCVIAALRIMCLMHKLKEIDLHNENILQPVFRKCKCEYLVKFDEIHLYDKLKDICKLLETCKSYFSIINISLFNEV